MKVATPVRPSRRVGSREAAATTPASNEAPGDSRVDVASEIRRKALSSVAMVAGRDTVVKAVAFVGNVAFARLLSPANFGAVAFGVTLLLLVQMLSDGGLGAGLIRRSKAPELEDLRVLLGYQLLLTVILAIAVAGAAAPFGRAGLVTAVMMPALPLLAFRAPSMIVFERDLNYAPLVKVEIIEQLSYYAWGVTTILLGAGVWGLASASVVKALVGTAAMLAVSPIARLSPSYSWRRLRPMLGFGVKFQAVQVVNIGGLQLLNVGIAGVGGLAVLGLWTMAWRLAQIPFLLFGALWRVSYAAASQLLAAGESARAMIERGLGLAAVGTGAILVPVTGAVSPLVPLVFGHRWSPVADVLPIAFFALQASGPVSVATAGYLYAVGDTSTVLRAAIATSVVWLLVALPLLPSLGTTAVAVGWMVSSLVEIPILCGAVRRRTGASLRPIAVPWVAASIAGAFGWLVSRSVSHGLLAAFLGTLVASVCYAGPIFLLRADAVFSIGRLGARAIARAR
jgi:O-antigen/teichoic acid export membrane protein